MPTTTLFEFWIARAAMFSDSFPWLLTLIWATKCSIVVAFRTSTPFSFFSPSCPFLADTIRILGQLCFSVTIYSGRIKDTFATAHNCEYPLLTCFCKPENLQIFSATACESFQTFFLHFSKRFKRRQLDRCDAPMFNCIVLYEKGSTWQKIVSDLKLRLVRF